jgi:methionine-rich copper-binding protein CopC
MKTKNYLFITLFISLLFFACSDNETDPEPQGNGFLTIPSLSFDVDIEVDDFSRQQEIDPKGKSEQTRRTTGANLEEFVVEILSFPGEDVIVSFENYSEALALGSIPLPSGNYTLRAFNDDFPSVSPSFDFPYFFGESPVFAIEFEETTEADDLVITAKNSKVTVNFSESIAEQFDSYQLDVTTSENDLTLVFDETETRSGFFSSSFDLSLLGTFTYTRIDGAMDTRTIEHVIPNILEGTAYIINIDVVLQDGEFVFNLILDDSFSEEVIDLGNGDIVDDEPFVPNGLPVITSPLNTFEENSTTTYNLVWESVGNATHYTVSTGTSPFSLTEFETNIITTSIVINLLEERNFFKVEAHFSDGTTTDYLGGNVRKLVNVNTVSSLNELTPVDEVVYNSSQTNVIDGENVLFQANDNTGSTESVRLHRNGDVSGEVVNLGPGGINEQIDYGDGGMSYYHYSSRQAGIQARMNDEYEYFTGITNPLGTIPLSQEFTPLAVRISLNNFEWSIGTAYFYIEKREVGTGAWLNINDGWKTSTTVFDYDVEVGVTYEYRFRVSSTPSFVRASNLSQEQSITIN